MKSIFSLFMAIAMLCSLLPEAISQDTAKKISRLGEYEGYSDANYKGFQYQSQYLSMPDGVRLATDIFLPKGIGKGVKVPTIVYFVRYGRSLELKGFMKFMGDPFFGHVKKDEIQFFTSHGYACMIIDLRGSGASFGYRTMEFSPEEVADMSKVLDWIVAQTWSDGKTATTGISYTGTTAELVLSSKHPSIKASIPRCNIFDLYTDMNLPGGIRQAPFVQIWKKTTQALDKNDLSVFGATAKIFTKGIKPVSGDHKRSLLLAAVEEHKKNFDIFSGLMNVAARNDVEPVTGLSCDAYSAHRRIRDIEASEVPIFRISGWYDGGNIGGVIKAYWNTKNTERVLIGAWDHGPEEHISPFTSSKKVKFNLYSEMLRFLDFHVKGIQNGIDKEPKFHYFQMGKERFESVNSWPLENEEMKSLYLNSKNQLSEASEKEATANCTAYKCAYDLGTGNSARWNSLTPLFRGGPIQYDKRKELNEKMLVFTDKATDKDVEITGHALVDFYISADAKDADIFVYIEDLAPNGKVTYITEGALRASHRKVSENPIYKSAGAFHSFKREDMQDLVPGEITRIQFDLQPISYLLRKGHCLRVSIASADVDHFELVPVKATELKIYHSAAYPSQVQIPFIK